MSCETVQSSGEEPARQVLSVVRARDGLCSRYFVSPLYEYLMERPTYTSLSCRRPSSIHIVGYVKENLKADYSQKKLE